MKRVMDIVISFIGLVCASPVLIPVMYLVWRQDGNSPFYIAPRVGRDGSIFSMVKLRSMIKDADKSGVDSTGSGDMRITKVGRFIRRYKLDELTQLWNVLKGDMSLVGPRPILEDEIPLFGDNIDYYIKVRPGITGLWQVSGRNDTSFQRRVYWDSWYVRNWSLWGDIVILIRTLGVVFGRKGAF